MTPPPTSDLRVLAHALAPRVIKNRRYLHQHPATRWEEDENLNWIWEQIREQFKAAPSTLPLRHRSEYSGGLVVDLECAPTLPWRLFRADIDALPISEAAGLPFASEKNGVMHACGHDAHSAILLGAYEAIQSGKVAPSCNIRWVWQRAEENPGTPPTPESGGARLVREGVCKNMSSAHALHIWADSEAGVFESCPGAMMANSGRIKINVQCSGGHVASPHSGASAARIANQICNALEGFQNTVLNPLESAVLEPVIIRTGTATNVRPAEAEVWFANRTFLDAASLQNYQEQIEKRVRSVVEFYSDAAVQIEFMPGHPALTNDADNVRHTASLLETAGQRVVERAPLFTGEDFAHYLKEVPGSMWLLGAHRPGAGGHHTSTFNPDESVFWQGVLFWLLLASSPIESR